MNNSKKIEKQLGTMQRNEVDLLFTTNWFSIRILFLLLKKYASKFKRLFQRRISSYYPMKFGKKRKTENEKLVKKWTEIKKQSVQIINLTSCTCLPGNKIRSDANAPLWKERLFCFCSCMSNSSEIKWKT